MFVNALVSNGGPEASGSSRRSKFPRSARLLRHADFEGVYKRGRRHFAAHMTFFYLPRECGREDDKGSAGELKGKGPRVGFTVGKVLGGAVIRNRMKRRLREAVRLQDPIPAAVDVVINPKKSLLRASFSDLQDEVAKAFAVIEKNSRRSQG